MTAINAKSFAIIPDQIWDGESESIIRGSAVVVNGQHIKCIQSVESLPRDTERRVVRGCTLIPGLIDAHVHYLENSGPLFLAAGVTTVRDVGNALDWILEQRSKNAEHLSRGPRIRCCGWLLDGPEGIWKQVVKRHANADALRASVRELVARGVDAIKLYASLDEPLLRAGVAEAHRNGMFTLAHLNSTTAEAAAKAGLNEIEHFSRCDVAWREASVEEDDHLIDQFLGKGVIMDPTLVTWDRLGRINDHTFFRDERRSWVHPQLLEIWDRFPYRKSEPSTRLRFQKLVPNLKRFFLRCHMRGVSIAVGTDTPFAHLIPGFSMHDELAQYVDSGLRPVDALRAATVTNARVLGLDSKIGRIRPGFDADLLAIEGNPIERIDDIANVRMVVRQGAVLDLAALQADSRRNSLSPMSDPMIRDLNDYVSGGLPAYKQEG